MESKSVADIIFNHIKPSVCEDITPVEVDYFDMCIRKLKYMQQKTIEDALSEYGIEQWTIRQATVLKPLYNELLKVHEAKNNLSMNLWSDRLLQEFENDFISRCKYV